MTSAEASPRVGSWRWTVFSLLGLALWIAGIVVAMLRAGNPNDGSAARLAAGVGGAIYFALLFGAAAIGMRRSQSAVTHHLYERLAVHPVDRSAIGAARAGMRKFGFIYLGLAAIVTAGGMTAMAVGDDRIARSVLIGVACLVVAWCAYHGLAFGRALRSTGALMAPLGLSLSEIPAYHYSAISDRGWVDGAMSYRGTRHGRVVTSTQQPKSAVTLVEGVGSAPATFAIPTTAVAMAQLTGEPVTAWRRVDVRLEDAAVVVSRQGNGAGAWLLYDVLLAELVADQLSAAGVDHRTS